MIPRTIADRIAQRVAKAAIVGALALGLAAPMLTPSAALAAPAAAPIYGTLKPDLVPNYGGGYSSDDDTGAGKPMWMWATVRNTGGQTVHGGRLVVSIPAQMTDVSITQGFFACSSAPGTRGKTIIVCDTDRDLAPNRTLGIEMRGNTPEMPGGYEVIVAVDPDNTVSELDEMNNTKIFPLVND